MMMGGGPGLGRGMHPMPNMGPMGPRPMGGDMMVRIERRSSGAHARPSLTRACAPASRASIRACPARWARAFPVRWARACLA